MSQDVCLAKSLPLKCLLQNYLCSSNSLGLSGRTGTFTECVLTVGIIPDGGTTGTLSILTPNSSSAVGSRLTFVALVFSGSAAFHHVLPGQVLPQRANENQGGADQVRAQMSGERWREYRGERESLKTTSAIKKKKISPLTTNYQSP